MITGIDISKSDQVLFDLDPGFSLKNVQLAAAFSKLVYDCVPTISGKTTDTKVLIQKCGKALVIAFQGTKDIQQFILDSQFWQKKDPIYQSVHHGFGIAYRDISTVLRQMVLYDDAVSQIFIFGHSLGGALATLCAYDLAIRGFEKRIQQVITFGSPRVGNSSFATLYNQMLGNRTFRVVRQSDGVTMVPWLGYKHVDNEYFIDDNDFLEFNPNFLYHFFSDLPVIVKRLFHGKLALLEDHFIDGDIEVLNKYSEDDILFVREKLKLTLEK